jgi:hypothetical protein
MVDVTLQKTMRKLVAVVFVGLAFISLAAMMTVRISNNSQEVSRQNRAFLTNFSDYMRCLVVVDPEAVKAYGLESYFNLCDELLFRNTGLVPHPTKVSIPSTTSTTK